MDQETSDLKQLYETTHRPGSLGGISTFLSQNKFKDAKHVKNEIRKLETYSLFVPARKNFKRRKMLFHFNDHVWCADLKILDKYKRLKANRNKAHVLIVICGFSKYLWVRAIKNKSSKVVAEAFKDILKTSGRAPKLLFTDRGTEFVSQTFKEVLDRYNIRLHHTSSSVKAAPAERVIRTIFNKISRIWHKTKSHAWLPWIQEVVDNYNATIHSSHRMAPKDVNESNAHIVWKRLYEKHINTAEKPTDLSVGDQVRVSARKLPWQKGYESGWSERIFRISKILSTKPKVFELEDIRGRFYREELQPVPEQDEDGISDENWE